MDERRLEAINAELAAHAGQFVLIIEHRTTSQPGTGCSGGVSTFYNREERLWLGIIADDPGPIVEGIDSRVPTTSYIDAYTYRNNVVTYGTWGQRLLWSLASAMDTPMDYVDAHLRQLWPQDHEVDLIVGDAAVEAWVRGESPLDSELSRTIGGHDGRALWLQRAAAKLSRPLASSPELDDANELERGRVLEQLWATNAKLEPVMRRLEAIRQAVKTGILFEGGAVSVVEDEDDVRVHSMGPRRELDDLLRQLGAQLARAVELGLGQHPYVLAFRLRYFDTDPPAPA